MSIRPVIWVTEPIHQDALALLRSKAEVLGPGTILPEQEADVTAIIVRNHPVNATLCDTLPNLKVVGKHGAGLDNIDTGALKDRAIQVFRAEGGNADSVAEMAVLFAMMMLRAPDLMDRRIREGGAFPSALRVGYELSERRVGILGMGAIGQTVASRLMNGFGAKIAGFDPGLPSGNWPQNITRHPTLETLLTDTDLLFLHLPLLPETKNLISSPQLAQLRPGAFIVNCARGGIIDEQALADALRAGHIAGAASDVFVTEPPSADNPLFAPDLRFIGTPHLGASTHAGLRRTGIIIGQKVLTALNDIEGKDT